MTTTRPHILLLLATSLLAMLALTSCGNDGGRLTGSLQNFYDIEYESVRARLYSSELAIEYVREDGEVPVRITLERGPGLDAGESFDLVDAGALTGRSRDTDMPPMTSGTLTLEAFELDEGGSVKGEFSASFLVGDDEATLTGEFDTTLEVVEAVEGYPFDFGTDMGDMAPEMGEE